MVKARQKAQLVTVRLAVNVQTQAFALYCQVKQLEHIMELLLMAVFFQTENIGNVENALRDMGKYMLASYTPIVLKYLGTSPAQVLFLKQYLLRRLEPSRGPLPYL